MTAPEEEIFLDHPGDVRARERALCEVIAAIDDRGYYLGMLPLDGQALADIHWIAREAGHCNGRPFKAYVSSVGARSPGRISVLVAPICGPRSSDPRCTWCGHDLAVELLGNTPVTRDAPTNCVHAHAATSAADATRTIPDAID